MPPIVAGKHRRKVRFPSSNQTTPNVSTGPAISQQKRPGTSVKQSKMSTAVAQDPPRSGIPELFTQPPSIRDPLATESSDLQVATLEKCLPFLKGTQSTQQGPFNAHGVPALQRDDHIAYLYDSLEDYPGGFVILDSSRPWMSYWGLAGLFMIGEDPTRFRERCVLLQLIYCTNLLILAPIVIAFYYYYYHYYYRP